MLVCFFFFLVTWVEGGGHKIGHLLVIPVVFNLLDLVAILALSIMMHLISICTLVSTTVDPWLTRPERDQVWLWNSHSLLFIVMELASLWPR